MAAPHVAERSMRDHDLTRRECAWIALVDVRACAEKGHLEAEIAPAGILDPTGDVPPLGPKRRMRAVVLWKAKRGARPHLRNRRDGRRNDASAAHAKRK